MHILIDMNLSPRWVAFLQEAGHAAMHWQDVGAHDAPDREIMHWAAERDHVVFTNDLDFTALLAATQAVAPSVVQIRTQDVLPEGIGDLALQIFRRFESELQEGALVSVELTRSRIRVLPLK